MLIHIDSVGELTMQLRPTASVDVASPLNPKARRVAARSTQTLFFHSFVKRCAVDPFSPSRSGREGRAVWRLNLANADTMRTGPFPCSKHSLIPLTESTISSPCSWKSYLAVHLRIFRPPAFVRLWFEARATSCDVRGVCPGDASQHTLP